MIPKFKFQTNPGVSFRDITKLNFKINGNLAHVHDKLICPNQSPAVRHNTENKHFLLLKKPL